MLWRVTVAVVLGLASVVLLLTAPVDDDFWWQDAPRHALNGAFVLDFVRAHPWRDPLGWAAEYYIRYPALTIGFYPPLFYAWEAVLFALFGVSHFVAQLAVSPFLFALGLGGYRLARLLLPRPAALGVGLLLLGAPGIALWGRQVMLDIPAHAALLWTVVCFASYVRHGRPRSLYGGIALFVASLYLKLNAAFIAVPIALTLLVARGWRVLLDRHLWIASALGAVACVPIVLLTLRFGAVNVENVSGHVGLPITSLAAWLFYIKALPEQIGWVPLLLGVAGVVWVIVRPPPLSRPMLVLFSAWLLFGYVAFSAIKVREARHDLMILFPLLLCAGYAVWNWVPKRWAEMAILGLGVVVFGSTVLAGPPPSVRGYQQVVDDVAARARPGAVIVYSGYRDGNFVFGMRTHPERSDLRILRTDKLFLRLAVTRNWGVRELGIDEAGLLDALRHNGVSLVVAQRGFWNDIPQMQRFNALLDGPSFRRVASYRITGDLSTNDGRNDPGGGMVDIYEPTYKVPPPPDSIDIDVPFGHVRLHGTLAQPGAH